MSEHVTITPVQPRCPSCSAPFYGPTQFGTDDTATCLQCGHVAPVAEWMGDDDDDGIVDMLDA